MITSVNKARLLLLDIDVDIIDDVAIFGCIDFVLEVHNEGIFRVVIDSESFHERIWYIINSHQGLKCM